MAPFLFFITAIFAFGYAYLLYWIMDGWDKTPTTAISSVTPKRGVTIIVAARNESQHISRLLDSFAIIEYPPELLEVIIVDDHSTDDTLQILKEKCGDRITLLQTTDRTGKKAAIELAVDKAKNELILCTDADCVVPPLWVKAMVTKFEAKPTKFLAGPIKYNCDRSILQRFQYLDSVANMSTTAAGIFYQSFYMANGANMAFSKSFFLDGNGYQNDGLASGDDMMLVQRAAKYDSDQIFFLKCNDAIVTTEPVKSYADLVQQRKRWATKTKQYSDRGIVKVQGYVFAIVMMLLLLLLAAPLTNGFSLFCFLFLLLVKWTMDLLFLGKMARYFRNVKPMKSFIPTSVLFILYIFGAAFYAFFPTKYKWKGRTID